MATARRSAHWHEVNEFAEVRLGSNGFGPWAEASGREELVRGFLAFRDALHDEPFERGLRRSQSEPSLAEPRRSENANVDCA